MTSVQTKIPFVERKKSSTLKFYSRNKFVEEPAENKTVKEHSKRSTRSSNKVKKIVYLDSDEENTACNDQDRFTSDKGIYKI